MHVHTIEARRSLGGIARYSMRAATPARAVRLPRAGLWSSLPVRIGLFTCAVLFLAGGVVDLALRSADANDIASNDIAPNIIAPADAPAPADQPAWIDITKPIRLFQLAGSELSRLPLVYTARRRPDGRERQDVLTYGRFGADAAFLRLSLRRTDQVAPAAPDLFVDLARLAAETGVAITRSALPVALPTRFGEFATTELTLSQKDGHAPCLGFRLMTATGAARPVDITGLACGSSAKPMNHAVLACVLDRIDLLSAGDDAEMQDFFVAAERRRGQECNSPRFLSPGGRSGAVDATASPFAFRRLSGGPERLR